MWRARTGCTLMVTLVVAAGLAAQSQAPADPPNPLATVKALKCRFPSASSAVWKAGEPQVQTRTQELQFDINVIDVQDGTAEYQGTAGRAFVTAVLSGWSLYFVENSIGQLNVTTVFAQVTRIGPRGSVAQHSSSFGQASSSALPDMQSSGWNASHVASSPLSAIKLQLVAAGGSSVAQQSSSSSPAQPGSGAGPASRPASFAPASPPPVVSPPSASGS